MTAVSSAIAVPLRMPAVIVLIRVVESADPAAWLDDPVYRGADRPRPPQPATEPPANPVAVSG